MELWRDIDGFPGYSISSEGRVSSRKNYQGYVSDSERILKPRINHNGYQIVTLYDEKHNPHQLSVHRLVAKAFLHTTDQDLLIDHIDMNKTNNRVSNLEWVTAKENSNRAFNAGLYELAFEKTRCPILVTNLLTGEETYYRSVNEAARKLNYSPSIISRAANMLCEKVGHYIIEFAGPEERLLFTNYETY